MAAFVGPLPPIKTSAGNAPLESSPLDDAVTPAPPLILTLALDARSFATLDALRARHFPPERNQVPTHLTLFHALPGDQLPDIREVLQELAARTRPLALSFPTLRFLGRGVAVGVDGGGLLRLREQLAHRWSDWLSAQDRQRFRPHVTIQNKARPTEARALHDSLVTSWRGFSGHGEALLLWRYLGGPWEPVGRFPFVESP
jgi:2'-5' RNA ligase